MKRNIALTLFLSINALNVRGDMPDAVPSSAADRSIAPLREQVEAARHAVRPVEGLAGQWWVQNPANGLNARFSPEGMSMRVKVAGSENHTLYSRWQTVGIGYGSKLEELPHGEVRAAGDRVEIERPGLIEWYVNRSGGLEHGYSLPEAPAGSGGGLPLRIEMRLEGDLEAEVTEGGKTVLLKDARGAEILRYAKLRVWDATGRDLEATMSGGAGRLAVEVDDTRATYPLTIDPIFTQDTYLKSSVPGTFDEFGWTVAISGNTAVVGAPFEDGSATTVNGAVNDGAGEAGAAYVFVQNAGIWSQQAYLKPSNAGSGDEFGTSVAISGDTIVVGANLEDGSAITVDGADNNGATDAGAAYVFVRSGVVWSQQAYLKPTNTSAGDDFGGSVAVSGDYALIGARGEDGSATTVNGVDNDGATQARPTCFSAVA